MGNLVAVAAGGAVGAVARWLVGLAVAFPFGTLAVNLLGSLAIGMVWAGAGARWHPLLITGVLGGFTTFSAFSLDVLRLAEDGRWPFAAGYVGLSVMGSLAACALGLTIARGWA